MNLQLRIAHVECSVAKENQNVVGFEVGNASNEGRDARTSRSHEVSDYPRLKIASQNLQKKVTRPKFFFAKKKIWLTLNPDPPPKPRNKCNPMPPHHGEDLSAE